MLGIWADYVGYPGGATLRAAGFTGVVRYVGIGGSAKRLTAAEYADLTAHGLQVLGVVESTTTRADAGYAAGVADARAAVADIAAITGGPGLDFVFATNDKPTFVQADVDYVAGFASVLGVAGTGAYGFASFLSAVRAAGHASVFWQAGSPPSVTGTPWVHFWQRQGSPSATVLDGPSNPTTVTVGGVAVDVDNQLLPLPGASMGMSNGTFEQGTDFHTIPFTTKATGSVIKDAWVSLRVAWGSLSNVDIFFANDGGTRIGAEIPQFTIPRNGRWVMQVPDGATGVNVAYTEHPDPNVPHCAVGWAVEYTDQ